MSIVSDILNEAATRLKQIKKPDFTNNVSQVVLPRRHQDKERYTPKDRDIIVRAADPERFPDHDRPGNPPAIGWRLPIQLQCIVIPSSVLTENAQDEIATNFGDDAIRAITKVENWHQFGGICVDANIENPTFIRPEDESPGGIQIEISAFYRVSENNPNEVRG